MCITQSYPSQFSKVAMESDLADAARNSRNLLSLILGVWKDIIDREISTIVPDPVDSMAIGEVPNNAAIAVWGSRLWTQKAECRYSGKYWYTNRDPKFIPLHHNHNVHKTRRVCSPPSKDNFNIKMKFLVAFSESYETLKSCVAFRPLSALRILDSCTKVGFKSSENCASGVLVR